MRKLVKLNFYSRHCISIPTKNAPSYALAVTHGLHILEHRRIHILEYAPCKDDKRKGEELYFHTSWLTNSRREGSATYGRKSEATRFESVVREASIRLDRLIQMHLNRLSIYHINFNMLYLL